MLSQRHRHLTTQQRQSHIRDRRVHLANERTFLAWIRTAVAIMAFGFVVEKFSMFYRLNMQKQGDIMTKQGGHLSDIIGISVVALGCFTGILAIIRYIRTEQDIEKGRFRPSVVLDLLFTSIFLVLAAFLIMYLVNSHLFIDTF